MILTESQYKEYLKAHLGLLYFVGIKTGEIDKDLTIHNFKKLDLKVKFKCREQINENPELINTYLNEKFDSLTVGETKIIEGFKYKITGDFVFFKCLKNFAIFLEVETNNFYAVKGLSDRFDDMLVDYPVLIKTTLLPFDNFIIYDGFLESYNMFFGKETTWQMNNDYKKAKEKNEVIEKINN